MSGGIPSSRERDPNQIKLENDVFAKMRDAIPMPAEDSISVSTPDVNHVSIEQALKELLDSTESIDDKS